MKKKIAAKHLEKTLSHMLCSSCDLAYDSPENQKILREYKRLHSVFLALKGEILS